MPADDPPSFVLPAAPAIRPFATAPPEDGDDPADEDETGRADAVDAGDDRLAASTRREHGT